MSSNKNKTSPAHTRSSSSSSTVSQTGTKLIPTTDELLIAIKNIQLSQDKLLAGYKTLSTDLKVGLSTLTSRFDSLSLEITALHNKVGILETKVLALESNLTTVPSTTVAEVIQEFTERDRCKSNIIAYGIPESISTDLSTKINDDKIILHGIFSKLSQEIPKEFKPIRLGKPSSSAPRPIKIIFNSHETASTAILAYRLAKTRALNFQPLTSLVRDKTPLERQQLRTCHLELERRESAGESNLTITYVNGIPTVTSRSKNFIRSHQRPRV
jgi:hypothetical protein